MYIGLFCHNIGLFLPLPNVSTMKIETEIKVKKNRILASSNLWYVNQTYMHLNVLNLLDTDGEEIWSTTAECDFEGPLSDASDVNSAGARCELAAPGVHGAPASSPPAEPESGRSCAFLDEAALSGTGLCPLG